MSTTIDQRVVEMQFDNRQFESNVQTSMSTLEKLKQRLNLTGASKGLDDINKAAKNNNLGILGSAADTVGLKFSALYTYADQTMRGITDSVNRTAKKMVSALTIDPIKSGLSEYETQINSVQTILANTESKGTNIDQVNSALDELNKYADQTIYNFTEMTRNIGTFTAAGVDLDKSVQSIKGIANLAAVSGSSSQQASTAMYQLSQALAAGKVSLMDWNSVVNAGMGGEVFQNALKRTSEMLGTGAEEAIKQYGTFRESLTKGEWLTTEVLTETLAQLSGAYTEADLIAQGYSKSQAQDIIKLSKTATDAATKVKTFTQLIDTTKESLQSGWTQTWEYVIGDFEQAKLLWTAVSDELGSIINKSSDNRNKVIGDAMTSNWDKMIDKIQEAGVESTVFEDKLKNTLKNHGYDVDYNIKKYGSLGEAFQAGALPAKYLTEVIDGLSTSMIDLSSVRENLKIGETGEDVKKVQEALKNLKYDIGETGADGIFGGATESAIKAFQEANELEVTGIVDEKTLEALQKASESAGNLKENCDGLIGAITELGGRQMLIESFKNIWEGLKSVVTPVKEAFDEIFPPTTAEQLKSFIESIMNFTEKLKLSGEQSKKLKSVFKGFFSIIDIGLTVVKTLAGGVIDIVGSILGFGDGILSAAGSLGDWITGLRNSIKETDIFGTTVDKVVGFITGTIDKIKEFAKSLKESFTVPKAASGIVGFFLGLWNIVSKVANAIIKTAGSISTTIGEAFGKGDIFEVFNTGLLSGIFLFITKFTKTLEEGFGNAGGLLENVVGIVDDVRDSFKAYQDQLKAGTLFKIAGAIGILAAAIFVISMIDPDKLAASLGAIAVLFGELLGSLAIFNKIGGSFKGTIKAIPLMIALSTAILILAAAMKVISTISWEGIAKGLISVGLLMAGLNLFLSKAKFDGKVIGTAVGIVILSSAILILAKAVKSFGSLSWEQIGKGLLALAVSLGAVVVALKLIPRNWAAGFDKFNIATTTNLVSAGIAFIAIAASMKILASALKDFGSLDWIEIAKGLLVMSVSLAAFVIAIKQLPTNKFGNLSGHMIGFGVGMMAMATSLLILTKALGEFKEYSWGEIAKSLVVMGIALIGFSKAMKAMNGSLSGAASLLIVSGALAIMVPTLKSLGKMSWTQIAKGLVALGGALAIIGFSAALLAPLTPTILALGAAIAVLGLGVAAIGAGLVMIGAGLTSISVAIMSGGLSIVTGLTSIILGLLNLVPEIAKIIGRTILEVAAILGDYAPQLAESLCKLLVSTVESLATYGPQLVNSLLDLLINLINGLADHMPTLIQAFTNLLGKVFEGVIDALNGLDTTNLLKGVAAVGGMTLLAYGLSGVLAILPAAMGGLAGVGVLITELSLILAAIGGLAQIPGLEWLISEGGDFLSTIGSALGNAIGSLIGGIGEGVSASLPGIGQNIVDFMDKLALASDNASGVDGTAFDGVSQLIGVMGDIALTTVGTTISDMFTLGGTSMEKFETDGVAFFTAMKSISAAATGITLDEESIGSVIGIATKLVDLQASLEPIGGVISWFTGRDDLGTFGTNAAGFISSMKTAFASLEGTSFNADSMTAIVDGAAQLSGLQNSLEPIGGVVSWFKGRDDLATFGTNVGSFISSMTTALGSLGEVTFNAESLTAIIDGATKLSDLQTKLEPIGGVISWFKGRDDLATFGTNVGNFISSMTTALSSLGEVTFNADTLTAIIDGAVKLSDLQSNLESVGGVVDWFTGRDDLGTFGTNVGQFISSMTTAFANVGDTVINSEAMTSIIDAATKLAGLQETLTPMEGVIGWFTGRSDLGTFGTKIGEFATAMGALKTNMGEDGITQSVVDSVTNAGNALIALNNALPEKGWFDSKEDLTDFSGHITTFATALAEFSSTCSGMNADGINVAITTANRIRSLVDKLADLDISGITLFAGDMYSYGSNGVLSTIGQAISGFADSVADINISGVSTAITVANKIKDFINNLASLDTSGVSSFTESISTLGQANVSGLEKTFSSVDLSSVGSNLMSSLTSGMKNSGASLSNTANTMIGTITNSIGAKSSSFSTAGGNLMANLVKGIQSKASLVKVAASATVSGAAGGVMSQYSKFYANGRYLGEGLVVGINSKKSAVYWAAYELGQRAVQGEKDGQKSNSPSKATIQAGNWFGEGLIIGINDMGTKVYRAGHAIGDTAVKSLSTAMARTSELVNGGMFDNQPTIRPVLDLSDVKAGAGSIGNLLGMGQTIGVSANVGAVSASMNSRIQNGGNGDVVSAINKLSKQLSNVGGSTYNVNGVTYDDGTNVSNAVQSLIRAAKIEGRA